MANVKLSILRQPTPFLRSAFHSAHSRRPAFPLAKSFHNSTGRIRHTFQRQLRSPQPPRSTTSTTQNSPNVPPRLDVTPDTIAWLQQQPPFSELSSESLTSLLKLVEVREATSGEEVFSAGDMPDGMYIIREGGGSLKCTASELSDEVTRAAPSGCVVGFDELLLNKRWACTLTIEQPSTLWVVPRHMFLELAAENAEFGQVELEQMSQKLEQVSQKLEAAQTELLVREQRQAALAAYIVAAPTRGIVGNSKYATRLRKDIVSMAKDIERCPVLIFGEPGLEKINVAALIHFGSLDRVKPMACLDCSRLNDDGAELFGRGSKLGLLHWLEEGTLVLNDLHKLNKALIPKIKQLVQDGSYRAADAEPSSPLQHTAVRVMMISEQRLPWSGKEVKTIKHVPLRVRPMDIAALQQYYLRQIAARRGGGKILLSTDALKALENYSFPNNVRELRTIVERAVAQAAGPQAQHKQDVKLTEEVFWFARQANDRYRFDLLKTVPALRSVLRSSLWPEDINFKFTAYIYPVYVALLMWGPQDRAHNFGLNLFWCYWWPIIFLLYPFLGRIWCAVCPFMIYGELMQRWRLSTGATLRKWPTSTFESYGPWFLMLLFGVILVWEEVWMLDTTAYLSAWLLIIITAGAVLCSAFFERRLWCRYLCPIGGMNGMFAKMSMTEVRSRQGVCSGNCSTYSCYKGGPADPPEGLESPGCPLYSHPAQLTDNRNCTLCMECLKACPNRSVQFRLRAPGIDLWTTHKGSVPELWLMYMLLGAVYLHRLPELSHQFGINPSLYSDTVPHIAASVLLLSLPGIVIWGVDKAARMTLKPIIRLEDVGYGYMPLVCGATLAHYLDNFLLEAGKILPVTAATFGFENLAWLPTFTADPAVVDFLQGTCLMVGTALSLALTRKIGMQPWKYLAPHCCTQVLLTAEMWALIV